VHTFSRICLALGSFLGVAAVVYGVTSHEPTGTTALLIAAVTFWFLSVVARQVAQREAAETEHVDEEIHIGPTIWPFGFAISAVIIGLGLVVSPWLLIPGGIGFALCAAGWLRDVRRSHAVAEH
jgi:hypothetical protein